jgi:hypothetical protein
MDLTKKQWEVLKPLMPKGAVRKDGRGRPYRDPEDVLNGIIWVLRTGAPWTDLPSRYPSWSTCYRRFKKWCADGTLKKILEALGNDLVERSGYDEESSIDGTYIPAKKGGPMLAKVVLAVPQSSWHSQMGLVFQSELISHLVRDMTLSSLSKRSTKRSSRISRAGSLATRPSTRRNSK